MDIKQLLKVMIDKGASDLHLKVGVAPSMRIDGVLAFSDQPPLTHEDTQALAKQLIPDKLKAQFETKKEVDFAFSVPNVGRFRVNVFRQQGRIGMALRRVSLERPKLEELGLPAVVAKLAEEPRGLVLVTGTAGSGKTTTLAAMIDHINNTRPGHIVTIEDPLEVLHEDNLCLIDQREIGIDTDSYADALRHVVRQDPDVILIGEMRDLETVGAAMTAAEMGTLVLSTLHTIDATETLNRIVDFFPPHHQRQIQLLLTATLRGIVSMRLLPKVGGGLVPAVEVLVVTQTVRELILENQLPKLKSVMEEGDYYGMLSFEQSLIGLYQDELITFEDAVAMAANAHDFKLKVRQLGLDPSAVSSDVLIND